MGSEIIIALLKAAGTIIGGVLGVVGLVTNFKNRNAGVLVLLGIVLAAIIGTGSSIVEGYKAKSDSSEQLVRTEHLLNELARSIQPITKLSACYWMEIPPGNKAIDSYIKRLSAGIETRIETLRDISHIPRDTGLSIVASDIDDEPINIEINNKSDLWPQGDEAFIGVTAQFLLLSVIILRKPTNLETFRPIRGAANLDFSADGLIPDHSVLSWDRKKQRLYVVARMEFNKGLWETNGKITSLVDLYGSQILLLPANSSDFVLPKRYAPLRNIEVETLDRSLALKTISLTFAEGRSIWISGKIFMKTKYGFGYPIFSVTLPRDEAEFRQFTLSKDEE
jgi:hypothetical protein